MVCDNSKLRHLLKDAFPFRTSHCIDEMQIKLLSEEPTTEFYETAADGNVLFVGVIAKNGQHCYYSTEDIPASIYTD